MSNKNEKQEAKQQFNKFLEEIKGKIAFFNDKKYSNKKEIDLDILEQKKLIEEINKYLDSDKVAKFITDSQLAPLFDEQDNLYERLSNLRKESRKILNEQSGVEIIADANMTICGSLTL